VVSIGVRGAGRSVDGIWVNGTVLVVCLVVEELDAVVREWHIVVGEVAHLSHLGVGLVADHGVVVEVLDVAPVVVVGVYHWIPYHESLEVDLLHIRRNHLVVPVDEPGQLRHIVPCTILTHMSLIPRANFAARAT
jgi:hypothetical protein